MRTACPKCGYRSSRGRVLCPKCRSLVLGGPPLLPLLFYGGMISILSFVLFQFAERRGEKLAVWISWAGLMVGLLFYAGSLMRTIICFRRTGVRAKVRKGVEQW